MPAHKPAPQIPPPGDYAPTGLDEDENPFTDPSEKRTRKAAPPFPEDRPSAVIGQFNERLGIEPYHPGFQETKSYVGRQDSSLGKVAMHAGAAAETPAEEKEESNGTSSRSYGAQPGNQAPIYRY
jgi:hypothetical protein